MPIARCVYAALILGFATAAQAQTAPAPARAAAAGRGRNERSQANCIAEKDEYKMRGKQPIFEIALENKCEQRMKLQGLCLYQQRQGRVQGRGTIVLARKIARRGGEQIVHDEGQDARRQFAVGARVRSVCETGTN